MFVFPLGLQAKTRDFPWVTLGILLITVIYSVANFNVPSKVLSVARFNEPDAIARFRAQKQLALAACPLSKFVDADCEFLERTLRLESGETEPQFILRNTHTAQARKIVEFVTDTKWKKVPEKVRALKEYAPFLEALAGEEAALAEISREEKLLTRSSFSWVALTRAQFLHGGWAHLIGNMIFFVLFAIPLEQRIGHALFALIYGLGGFVGLGVEIFLDTNPIRPILGASANVSAVAAAFMIAFWFLSVRLWVSMFFVVNRVVLIRTWLFFAFFVLVQDVTGVLDIRDDGVAHLAHLGGFGIGALIGAIAIQMKVLPKSFAFPFEHQLILDSRASQNQEQRFSLWREVLFHNPRNLAAAEDSWREVCGIAAEMQQNNQTWEGLPKPTQIFLTERFCELLKHAQKTEKQSELGSFFNAVESTSWPMSQLIPASEVTRMMRAIGELDKRGWNAEALTLLRLVIAAHPQHARVRNLRLLERKIGERSAKGQRDGHETRTGS